MLANNPEKRTISPSKPNPAMAMMKMNKTNLNKRGGMSGMNNPRMMLQAPGMGLNSHIIKNITPEMLSTYINMISRPTEQGKDKKKKKRDRRSDNR